MRRIGLLVLVVVACVSVWGIGQTCSVQVFLVSVGTGDSARAALLQSLNGARATLDVAVGSLTDDDLAEAIARAHRRGVIVRVILAGGLEQEFGGEYDTLRAAGIQVRLSDGSGTFGHRFAIVDETTVLTGSYAWVARSTTGRFDDLVKIICPTGGAGTPAAAYQAEFDRLWVRWAGTTSGGGETPSPITTVSILAVDRNEQCIDLFNTSDRDVDISHWALSDLEGQYAFPSGTLLVPYDPFRICIDEFNPTHDVNGLFLDPVSDEVFLVTPGGTIVDEVIW
jgi:hypothetical protein